MANKETNLPSSLHDEPLTAINGIKFTNREIDVITLIFHTRGSSKIASFLSISTRTVETHTANIMRKMDANSREGIIDFVEKSGNSSWVKKHYRNLLTQIDFKKHLLGVFKLIRNQNLLCSLIYEHELEEDKHFISILKDHLILCGIKVTINESRDEKSVTHPKLDEEFSHIGHTIYLIPRKLIEKFNIDKKECQLEASKLVETNASDPQSFTFIFNNKNNTNISKQFLEMVPCVCFWNPEEYYFSFFDVLKRIFPAVNLDKIISEFKNKHESDHDISERTLSSTPSCSKGVIKKDAVFRNKIWLIIITSILIIITLFIGLFLFKYGEFSKKTQTDTRSTASIRSDLVIPTGNTFLERPHIIEKIEKSLRDGRGIQTVALVGIGGAGKTTIAREYALQKNANIVWEINAVTRENLRESFERLAYNLCKSEQEKVILEGLQNIKNKMEKDQKILLFVKEKMKKISNWILIYDNVEKFTDIYNYFPCDPTVWGNGKVIVTTSNSNTSNNNFINSIVQIGELSNKEKLILFVKIMKDDKFQEFTSAEKEQANTFLNDVPPYPLDISIAAYYLKSTNTPYGEYLEKLKGNYKEFDNIQADVVKEASGYTKTRYGIITLSVKELITIHKDFQDLLLLVSLIGYHNIPKSLLAQFKSATIADNFIYHLKKYSLITNESFSNSIPTISIHKKTQETILSYLINSLKLSDNSPLLHPIITTVESYVLDAVDKEDFSKMKLLVPHGEMLLNHDDLLSEATKSSLRGSLGCIYYYLKHYPKIRQFLEENLTELRQHYGEKHDKIARILVYLGNFHRTLGDHERAKTLLEQSLTICKENPNYLRSAKALGYLGAVYRDLGEYKKAKNLFEQSLVIYEKYSPNSIGHAWILAYLGNIHRILGDYEKAKTLLEQGLVIYKKQSEDYVGAAWVLGYLGTVHRLLGDCKTAKSFIEKALSITRKHFADDHIYVASHISALAKVYIEIGDYKKAKTLLKGNLNVYETNYGKNHIRSANVLRMLGEAYCLEGDLEASEELINKSLLICQQKNSPASFKSLESLADLYTKKAALAMNEGDAKQAQNYSNRSIHYLKQSLQVIRDYFSEDSPHAAKIQLRLNTQIGQMGK